MNSQEFAHSNRFICGKPVVTWCKLWCKLSAKSRLYAVILTYTPSISPAASSSGNYDLNGQRSASPCWPSLTLCSHQSSFYLFIMPLFRCSATWNFNWTHSLNIAKTASRMTDTISSFLVFRNMVSPTPTAYSLFRHSTVIRNFLNRLSHSTFHHSSNLPISRLAYIACANLIIRYLEFLTN